MFFFIRNQRNMEKTIAEYVRKHSVKLTTSHGTTDSYTVKNVTQNILNAKYAITSVCLYTEEIYALICPKIMDEMKERSTR